MSFSAPSWKLLLATIGLYFLIACPASAGLIKSYVAEFYFDDFNVIYGSAPAEPIVGSIGFTIDSSSPGEQHARVDYINLGILGFSFAPILSADDFFYPGQVAYETSAIIPLGFDNIVLFFGTEFFLDGGVVNGINAVGDDPADFVISAQLSAEPGSLFQNPLGFSANLTAGNQSSIFTSSGSIIVSEVPLPGALPLFALGCLALGFRRNFRHPHSAYR